MDGVTCQVSAGYTHFGGLLSWNDGEKSWEGDRVELKFLVEPDLNGSPFWWLYSTDGEMLAWAGQHFASLEYARKSALAFKSSATAAKYEIYPHADGGWRWRALQYIDYAGKPSWGPGSMKECRLDARTPPATPQ